MRKLQSTAELFPRLSIQARLKHGSTKPMQQFSDYTDLGGRFLVLDLKVEGPAVENEFRA